MAELCAALTAEFTVDDDTCRVETAAFVSHLLEAGLVEVDDA
jgi:hypothetical protein